MTDKAVRLAPDYGELSYNEENKNRFLRDARRVLEKAIELAGDTFALARVDVNRGGIAVSGEVYGYLVLPDMQNVLFVEISQACVPGVRRDHVAVLLQYRRFDSPVDPERKKKGKVVLPGFQIVGNNQWLLQSDLTAETLRYFIEAHARVHPEIIKDRANLRSEKFQVDDIPTVAEAIAGGGEIGKTLLKIKHAFNEFNAAFNECNAEHADVEIEDDDESGDESGDESPELECDPVREAIASARLEDGKMVIEQELDRDLYLKVAAIIKKWGGKWSRKDKAFVFDHDPSRYIEDYIGSGHVEDFKKRYQFFETPRDLAEMVVAMANITPGAYVLEPSAGRGRLAEAILKAQPDCTLHVCEIWDENRKYLAKLGLEIVGHDFLQMTDAIRYDFVVMNPPYRNGQYIQHVMHAYNMLKHGGTLVAITPESWSYRKDSMHKNFGDFIKRAVIEEHGEAFGLKEGAFKESGTMVKTGILKITRTRSLDSHFEELLQPLLKEPAVSLPDIAPPSNDEAAGDDLLSIMGL